MRKITFLFPLLLLLFACSGTRQTRKMITSGDYNSAIIKSVKKLQSNKYSKGNQDYVYYLEEAYAKANERDLRNINNWFKDANPNNLEKIYNTYLSLNSRQELILPLLPLKLLKENRNAIFTIEDYSDQIISTKNTLSKFLYENAKSLLTNKDKLVIRRAYDDLNYLESINPGYKNVHQLMDEAISKGTDYVIVNSKNETNMVIPEKLNNNLLDFNTYGLNDKWTVYHSVKQKGVNYDYNLALHFSQILISPETIKEKQFEKEKQVKDGQINLLDSRGNPVKDQSGNIIKVDKMKTIKISIYEVSQLKNCQINALVDYIDLKSGQKLQSFPITSEFIFSNVYSTFKGDKQACEESYYPNFDRRLVPFPSNEQMIYDTGNDLKTRLKNILNNNKFRK